MTPFNLEKAKAGAAVKTRGGKPARIVCFDAVGPEPLVVLIKDDDDTSLNFGAEDVFLYSLAGLFNRYQGPSSLDLVMA